MSLSREGEFCADSRTLLCTLQLKSEIEHMHSNIRQRERSLLDLRQQHEELTQRLKQDSSEHSHQVEILQVCSAADVIVVMPNLFHTTEENMGAGDFTHIAKECARASCKGAGVG